MTSQPQHRLLGFGSNYFHALGGSEKTQLLKDVPAHEYAEDAYDVQQLCCTTTSTVILTKPGNIYQVGMMHGKQWKTPTRIPLPLPLPVTEIAGGRHYCLARCGSAVLSWGAGHFGQLGQGPNVSFLDRPEIMQHLLPEATGSNVVQIACGDWHGCALTEDGRIFAWGSNRRHQCGSKSPSTVVYPTPIDVPTIFSKIVCGKVHNVALEKTTGRVYTWGASVGCGHSSRKTVIAPPRLVEALQRVVIVNVAAGDAHSLALTGGGRVFTWGRGHEGQLGVGGAFPIIPRPKLVGDLDFVAVVAGQHLQQQNCGSSSKSAGEPGSVPFTQSLTKEQQLAAVSQILASVPKVVRIFASGSYSLAVSSAGHVYAWGYNDTGVLGLPVPAVMPSAEPLSSAAAAAQSIKDRTLEATTFDSRHNVLLPIRIDALSGLNVKQIAGGPSHFLVYGQVRDPNESTVVGRTLYEIQQARRRAQERPKANQRDSFSVYSADNDAVSIATASIAPSYRVPTKVSATPVVSGNGLDAKLGRQQSEKSVDPSVASGHSRSRSRTMSMANIMQRLTNRGGGKNGKDTVPTSKLRRVLRFRSKKNGES